ncbi:hypothetical protein [Petroclostridium sp. X23]|uniref:hypothetical protein n=1 Tax=Petroclostridium sp. X23 TaxID=3045146 RepID=UPI0024ADC4B8|nr:hypothetical protein [Petroclostridium sp. X23]WHH59036.1 hypothetical protein QKW49_25155 [Petroclostridium sp. X23]
MIKKQLEILCNGSIARKKGQKMIFVTERAVFELRKEGPVLIEITPGIDLKRDVLSLMEFTPVIDRNLKVMDARIFEEGQFGLKEIINKK